MIYPEFLKDDDVIGISAPSDGVVQELDIKRLDNAIKKFNDIGYRVVEAKSVRKSTNGKSNDDSTRAREVEDLFKNRMVKAIFSVGGGDFLLPILSEINFEIIKNNPKWLQGYSDPTGLLFTITTNLDIATIYADNFKAFGMGKWHKSLKNNLEILKGNLVEQKSFSKYQKERVEQVTGYEGYSLDKKVEWKAINCDNLLIKGRIIGGCIDILNDLFGTRFDKTNEFIDKYKSDGIIWYFDNCELSNDQLIRTLWKFRDSGWFRYTKGIVFGRSMTNSSYYGITLESAIEEVLKDLEIPTIIDADIGHISPRMTIINGAIATIKLKDKKGSIKFELV